MWSEIGCSLCTSRRSKGESGAGIMSNFVACWKHEFPQDVSENFNK